MRVLLLAVYNYHMNDQLEEIGIGHIASFLRRESYEVRLLAAMENRLDYREIVRFKPDIIGLPGVPQPQAKIAVRLHLCGGVLAHLSPCGDAKRGPLHRFCGQGGRRRGVFAAHPAVGKRGGAAGCRGVDIP